MHAVLIADEIMEAFRVCPISLLEYMGRTTMAASNRLFRSALTITVVCVAACSGQPEITPSQTPRGSLVSAPESSPTSVGAATPSQPTTTSSPTPVASSRPPATASSASPTPSATYSASPAPSARPSSEPSRNPTSTESPTATPAPLPSEAARSAYDFINSIGADSHFNYPGEVYVTNYRSVASETIALGIKHLRDGGTSEGTRLSSLAAYGIMHSSGGLVSDTASDINARLESDPFVEFTEPQNEYDSYAEKDPNWVAHLRAEQILLYKTVKENPKLSHITVLGPALASLKNYAVVGDLSAYMDIGNEHDGTCFYNPGETVDRDNNIQLKLTYLKPMIGSRPIYTTESAYTDNMAQTCGVPDDIIAKYDPRTIAERWNDGITRTYFYQLADTPDEGEFADEGLLSATGQPLPQYEAMKSMMTLLQSGPPTFTPAPLRFKLSGATTNVHHTLLQAAPNIYFLLIWIEAQGFDPKSGRIVVPNQLVTLTLPSTLVSLTSYSYDSEWHLNPTILSSTNESDNTRKIALSVSDSVSFIKIDL